MFRPAVTEEMLNPLLRAIQNEIDLDEGSPLAKLVPGLENAIEKVEFKRWKEQQKNATDTN